MVVSLKYVWDARDPLNIRIESCEHPYFRQAQGARAFLHAILIMYAEYLFAYSKKFNISQYFFKSTIRDEAYEGCLNKTHI